MTNSQVKSQSSQAHPKASDLISRRPPSRRLRSAASANLATSPPSLSFRPRKTPPGSAGEQLSPPVAFANPPAPETQPGLLSSLRRLMNQAEIICTLLIVVAALAILAKKVALPYPVLLVIGGLALGFVPGLPAVQLEPEMVFLFLFPPLLYPAALFTSWRDFRANLSPISLLAIGLVLFTTAFVAGVAHALTGLPWPAAFVLGAIISPTDAIAATAITNRLRVPQRIVTILEGESLVNDATALVAYRFAIAAMISGRFSLSEASGRFVLVALGGTGIGLAVGWLAAHVQRRLDDPPVQITISLLTPFAAYIPAERLHVSGVLAVVASGLFLGWRAPQILTSRTRLNIIVFWEMMVFLLNGLVFVLIGLQLPRILHTLSGHSLKQLVWHGALISCAAIVVRIAWVFTSTYRVAFDERFLA